MAKGVLTEEIYSDCDNCGLRFRKTNGRSRFHDKKCRSAYQAELRARRFAQSDSRRCHRCGQTKASSQFTPRANRCKACNAEYHRARKEADPGLRRRFLLARYGLDEARFAQMLDGQEGKCAICRSPDPAGHGQWHIDHDRACCPRQGSCGRCVRGILCHYCNLMIGMAKENPETFIAALRYLGYEVSGLVYKSVQLTLGEVA